MSASSGYLSAVLSELVRRGGGGEPMKTRVLFPDKSEMLFQRAAAADARGDGGGEGPPSGGNIFSMDQQFRTGYLTDPSPWLEVGWDKGKKPIKELTRAADDDELYVAAYEYDDVCRARARALMDRESRWRASDGGAPHASLARRYPHFNVNETLALRELDEEVCEPRGRPLLIFNGELDRFRGGYYPKWFYPKVRPEPHTGG